MARAGPAGVFNPLSYNDAGERTVVEQFDGKQFVQYSPGVYYAGFFAKERPWPNQISVSYQADAPDLDLKDGTIEIGKQTIRFGGDATSASISGIVQYILPVDEKEMIEMHNAHRTPQSLVQKRLAPYTKECYSFISTIIINNIFNFFYKILIHYIAPIALFSISFSRSSTTSSIKDIILS